MDVYLERVDPARNCFRFYAIRTAPDLFEEAALVIEWGRIGRLGRVTIRRSGSRESVEAAGREVRARKLRRGYVEPGRGRTPP
jgi:predicted DNA-binding WGR domain protein